ATSRERPGHRLRRPTFDRVVAIGGEVEPGALLAVRPGHAHVSAVGTAKPDVDGAQLSARVAAADGELALLHQAAGLDLDPGADRVTVRTGLMQVETEPVSHRLRLVGRARPDVLP